MGRILGVVGASAFCALLACSSSSTPGASAAAASCGKVMPCGGSVVGTWTVAAACLSGTVMVPAGTGCTITESLAPSFTGTATYNADGTGSANIGESIDVTENIPAACLSQGGMTVTCAQLQASLSGSFGDGGAGASCSTAGTGCTCTITMSTPAMMTSGTYTTMGNNITTTANSDSGTSTPSTASYCVVGGNTLHLISATSLGMGSMGTMGVTVDIVLTK